MNERVLCCTTIEINFVRLVRVDLFEGSDVVNVWL
jgi:hypothetical protein